MHMIIPLWKVLSLVFVDYTVLGQVSKLYILIILLYLDMLFASILTPNGSQPEKKLKKIHGHHIGSKARGGDTVDLSNPWWSTSVWRWRREIEVVSWLPSESRKLIEKCRSGLASLEIDAFQSLNNKAHYHHHHGIMMTQSYYHGPIKDSNQRPPPRVPPCHHGSI